jgi:rRNA maturation endonuclease Nob1
MAKQKCQKCGKTWNGWAQPDICPDCDGKLENINEEKEDQNITKENVK